MLGISVPICSPLPIALSRGWYSADVHGRPGREPSLFPGASSAALSLVRMVPVFMPSRGGPLEGSPMLCRVLDGVWCW